jgi:hypothetical protein
MVARDGNELLDGERMAGQFDHVGLPNVKNAKFDPQGA